MDYYQQLFKRRSFHLFRGAEAVASDEMAALEAFLKEVVPLEPDIRTAIKIVPESETTCRRGAEYCIEFFSEEKSGYLANIGYIGEQIDLWCASRNIGALWFGIGKPDVPEVDGMPFVIMIAIAKMPLDKFRKDVFKAKRKPLPEIWSGDTLGAAEIARFAPSACNTQPWYVENAGDCLKVCRFRKPGKRGIMPADKVAFYNRIDIGIFLFVLETCLAYRGYAFERTRFCEPVSVHMDRELTPAAEYRLKKK